MDKHRTLALIVLAGAGTFLYQIAQLLGKIESWEVIWNPPNVAQMLLAIVAALTAIAAALGLNVPALLAGLLKKDVS